MIGQVKFGGLLTRLSAALTFALVLAVSSFDASAQSDAPKPVRISIAYCIDCVPFQFRDEKGQPAGSIIDLWRIWSKKTGIAVEFMPAAWDKLIPMVFDSMVDAHAGLFFNKNRDRYLDYGAALRKTDTHIFTHQSIPPSPDLEQLRPYRIGVIKGDFVQGYLKRRLPKASIIAFDDYVQLVGALRDGAIKVFAADTPTGLYHLEKAGLAATFRHQVNHPLYQNDWYVAVRQGNRRMLDIINAGMKKIGDDERRLVGRAWSGGQKKKIDSDATIIAVDRNYPPFSFVGPDGEPAGFLVDLWRLWGKAKGKPVSFRLSNWTGTLEAIRKGEADIHSGLFESDRRREWLAFSEPLHEISTALFARRGVESSIDLKELTSVKVGVIAASYQEQYLEEVYPAAIGIPYDDTEGMIIGLLKGEAQVILYEEPLIQATLNRLNLPGALKRIGESLMRNKVHAGVPNDNLPVLQDIDDGLRLIPKSKLAELEARWLPNVSDRFYAKSEGGVELTPKQIAWIYDHPEITVAATADWPPFEWKTEDGFYRGITADFARVVADRVGLKLKIVFKPWAEELEMLKRGELDLAPGLYRTDEREKYMAFTRPFIELFDVITVRADRDDIRGIRDLNGKTIAVEKGYSFHEILKNKHPEIKLKVVTNALEALKAVISGEADAYIGLQLVTSHLIEENLLKNLKSVGFFSEKPQFISMGVPKDREILRDILDRGIKALSNEERSTIIKSHVDTEGSTIKRQVPLTLDEGAWVQDHKKLRLGADRIWPPFEFVGSRGEYKGMAVDFTTRVTDLLGFELVPTQKTGWGTAFGKLARRDLDILAAVIKTPEREKRVNFTKPYLSFPVAIVMRNDAPGITGLGDLNDKKVGVVTGQVTQYFLRQDHPSIDRVPRPTVGAALRAVSNGEIDAYVGNLAAISYGIDKLGLSNLKVAGSTPYTHDLAMATRMDWPQLTELLDKALESLTDAERAEIKNRWIAIDVKLGLDWKTVVKWVAPIGGGALVIIVFVVVWNRRMGREIGERKAAEIAVVEKEKQLRTALDSMTDGMYLVDEDMNFVLFNQRYLDLVEVGKVTVQIGGPVADAIRVHAKRGDYGEGEIDDLIEKRLVSLSSDEFIEAELVIDGGKRILELRKAPIDGGGAVVVVSDISARKQAEQALAESERRFREILETSPVGITVVDDEGVLEFVNPRMGRMLDRSSSDLIGKLAREIYKNPLARDEINVQLQAEGRIRDKEVELVRADGETIWSLLSLQPATFEGREAFIGWLYDITARKKADEELARQQALLEITLESMDQGITLLDSGLNYVLFNRRLLDVMQLPAEWYGKPFTAEDAFRYNAQHGQYGPGNIEEMVQERLELCKVFEPHQFERTIRDGRVVEVRGVPSEGYMVTTYTDITERKQAEEEIAEKERQLRAALDNMSDGIFMVDAEGRYVLFNNRHIELAGSPSELFVIGGDVRGPIRHNAETGIYGPGDVDEQVKTRTERLLNDQSTESELRFPSGRFVQYRKGPAEGGGAVVVTTDVTDRVESQKELEGAYEVISSSIQYASRIQRSILPSQDTFPSFFADHFIIWEPRDVVGGDVYWCRYWGNGLLVVVADCTGHGVPGAFMTLISSGALDRAETEVEDGDLADLVQGMHRIIQTVLNQDVISGESDDGLELGACYVEPDSGTLRFVGARFSLFMSEHDGDEISEIKGDKSGLGYRGIPRDVAFKEKTVKLAPESGQAFYMTSDGLIDQVGGEKRLSFGKRRLKALLMEAKDLPMAEQKDAILAALASHQGAHTRRDDLCILGFRVF